MVETKQLIITHKIFGIKEYIITHKAVEIKQHTITHKMVEIKQRVITHKAVRRPISLAVGKEFIGLLTNTISN